ncbi:hypothetical protein [Nonomuraea sp. NPDC049646]|uniref:hypothetical protein n=1 Tax=unclassified Nonomuraea TaxID=2593643 RepID=UPI00378DC244
MSVKSNMTPEQHMDRAHQLLAEAATAQPWGKGAMLAQLASAHFAAVTALRSLQPPGRLSTPANPRGIVSVRLGGHPEDVKDAVALLSGKHIHLDHQQEWPGAAGTDVAGDLDISEWRAYVLAHHPDVAERVQAGAGQDEVKASAPAGGVRWGDLVRPRPPAAAPSGDGQAPGAAAGSPR